MGMSAAEVGRLSLWQFNAQADGWQRANGGDDLSVEPPTYEEFRAVMDAPVGGYRGNRS